MGAKNTRIGLVQIGSMSADEPHVAVIEVGENVSMSTEIRNAISRGENPAKALLFLANLAARHCHPHHCQLTPSEADLWRKYFG